VTPICSEHAALLKRIADNVQDFTAQKVYSDWLQERDNAGWFVVSMYPIEDWSITIPEPPYFYASGGVYVNGVRATMCEVRLPWLAGKVEVLDVPRTKSLIAAVLKAYAEGKAK